MKLSQFITENVERILTDWQAFAETLLPSAAGMSSTELRDHAGLILAAVVIDLDTAQTSIERDQKSKGLAPAWQFGAPESAASTHGALRGAGGFTLVQLFGEFRALRASVLRLWLAGEETFSADATGDLMRFNEAIDQALAESAVEFEKQSTRTRDTFLAMLGHDLRGPLATMAAAGSVLVHPAARPADVAATGHRVKRAAATMASMVDDLFEYSRVQLGGAMPLNLEASDLQAVARDSIQDANAVHPDCPIELEAVGTLQGSFDAVRMQQLITNLLNNAAQYGDRDFPVKVSLQGKPDHLAVSVMNRGSVIPASAFKSIFSPMVQLAHMGDGRPGTSVGLGLFIAREIARAHGGTIGVASTEEDGTIFTANFPRAARAPAAKTLGH